MCACCGAALRVLIVAGGCCHEYDKQHIVLKEGIESRINAIVDVAYNPDKTTKATFEIYKAKDWAKDFDVIIHDECSADITDPAYVGAILDAHKAGKPAVNLHCAMHSYRWGNFREPVKAGADNAGWYEMIGLQSTGHGPQQPIARAAETRVEAMVPAIVAALWGSSWQLVSGPTTAISIVVFATISPLAAPGSEDYVRLVLTLTFLVGVFQLLLGALRLGSRTPRWPQLARRSRRGRRRSRPRCHRQLGACTSSSPCWARARRSSRQHATPQDQCTPP